MYIYDFEELSHVADNNNVSEASLARAFWACDHSHGGMVNSDKGRFVAPSGEYFVLPLRGPLLWENVDFIDPEEV